MTPTPPAEMPDFSPDALLRIANVRQAHYNSLMAKVTKENGNIGANSIQRRHLMDDAIAVENNALLAIAGYMKGIHDLLHQQELDAQQRRAFGPQ